MTRIMWMAFIGLSIPSLTFAQEVPVVSDFYGVWSDIGDSCRSYRAGTEGPYFEIGNNKLDQCKNVNMKLHGNTLDITAMCREEEEGYTKIKTSFRISGQYLIDESNGARSMRCSPTKKTETPKNIVWRNDFRRCISRAKIGELDIFFDGSDGLRFGIGIEKTGQQIEIVQFTIYSGTYIDVYYKDGDVYFNNPELSEKIIRKEKKIFVSGRGGSFGDVISIPSVEEAFKFLHSCTSSWENWQKGPHPAPLPTR